MKFKILGSKGTASFKIQEALDKEGKDWEVVLVEAGESLNNRVYPPEVLKQALPLFEQCKGFAYEFDGKFFNHVPDKARSSVQNGFTKNLVSFFENVRFGKFKDQNGNEKEGILAKMHILDSAKWLREMLIDAWEHGKKNLLGLSLDGDGKKHQVAGGKEMVDQITAIDEMTFVSVPAAGGRLTRLLASKEEGIVMKELFMKLIELLKGSSPDIVEGLDANKLTPAQEYDVIKAVTEDYDKTKFAEKFGDKVKEALGELIDKVIAAIETDNKAEAIDMLKKLRGYQDEAGMPQESKAAEEKKKADEKVKADAKAKEGTDAAQKSLDNIKKMEEDASKRNCTAILNEKLSACDLPVPMKEAIRGRFKDSIFEVAILDAAIKEQKDILAKLAESKMYVLAGQGNVELGQTEREKLSLAMDGFFEGQNVKGLDGKPVQKFMSFREAFKAITKNPDPSAQEILAGCYGFLVSSAHRLSESISTTTFAQILGDSITRKMIKDYNTPGLSDWRKIVSDIVPISDFRTNRRTLFGGYGNLPAVSENGSYVALTSPGDDENTYAVSKKGGLETISMETIANDDVGLIRRIPKSLGLSAAQTLYTAIFNLLKNNTATCYDGVVLFHADHANLGSTALSSTAMTTTKAAMNSQTAYGNTTRFLGVSNNPKYIMGPVELEEKMFKLCASKVTIGTSEVETSPNFHGTYGMEPIVVPEWTDATDWVAVADPKNVPTIEVGFLNGKEEPELFIQDMPNVGSMFDADQVKYKIRHIWGLVLLDYRPFYKHVVSGS